MINLKEHYGEENHLNLKLVVALSRTTAMLHRTTQNQLSIIGLTLAQFGVLEALYHLGDLKICEIIEKTLSSSGNMTVVINNLERDGYVTRYNCSEDKRVTRVRITEKGSDLISKFFPEHVEQLETQMSKLNFEERRLLLKLLKQLNGVEER